MTKIEWTDETWNYQGGCSAVSTGCLNCAACRVAATRLKNHPHYKGLTKNGKWTGEVRMWLDDIVPGKDYTYLNLPFHLRKPRMIFPAFMSDMFHENVLVESIGRVLNVIGGCREHTFQILTKRLQRADEILCAYYNTLKIKPFKNLWLGTSISTQEDADKNIPILLRTPAAVRFVNFEPLLEAIYMPIDGVLRADMSIDWAIIGCESGPKRRECKLEWVRDIIEQCKAANVPVFVKQIPLWSANWDKRLFETRQELHLHLGGATPKRKVSHKPEEWPEWAKIRQMPKENRDGYNEK